MQQGQPGIPGAGGRQGALENVGPVLAAFLGQHQGACAGLVGLLEVVEGAGAHRAFLEDARGLERDVTPGGFGKVFKRQEQGQGDRNAGAGGEGETVVHPVVDALAPDGQFPAVRLPEVDPDGRGRQLDFPFGRIRRQGVVVLGVPLPALGLGFAGDFRQDVPGQGNVRRHVGQRVDRGFAYAGKDDVDGFQFRGGTAAAQYGAVHMPP